MQYITPGGETGTKVNENTDLGKYQLELPSQQGEAPRFEWFNESDLLPVDDTTGLPGPVPQEPIEEMDLLAQLQNENALQAMELIDYKACHEQQIKSMSNMARQLDAADKEIADLKGQLDLANNEVTRLHEAGAAAPPAPVAPTPSINANNPG